MWKIIACFVVFHIIMVTSTDICLKAYKKKLCIKLSIPNYDKCLFEKFDVFEQNNKFCVSNTKCVPKTSSCSGLIQTNLV